MLVVPIRTQIYVRMVPSKGGGAKHRLPSDIFLVPGHTKFAPDRLFSNVAHSYNHSDVFNVDELNVVCSQHAVACIKDGNEIFQWRTTLEAKYGDLPGVRKYLDFLTCWMNDEVKATVRGNCYTGGYSPSPQVIVPHNVLAVPENYEAKRRELTEQKLSHMQLMYRRWVVPSRWPIYLPPSQANDSLLNPAEPSQPVACHPGARQRKPSKCSTPGCKGLGHKNPAKWSQGHSMRAGCPMFHT